MYLHGDSPKPSVSIKIGHYLKQCAHIVSVKTIVVGDKCMREKLQDFLLLYKNEWLTWVSATAQGQINENRFNKALGIPEEEDIMRYNEHFFKKENDFISSEFKNTDYSDVTKNTLAHIITFNRRTVGGEVQRLKTKAYMERNSSNKPLGMIEEKLSEADKNRGSRLQRIEVRGEKGNKSPILLTESMVKCTDFMLKVRKH